MTGKGPATILEFHSNKITRVVKSSMAAESSSMSTTADRLIFNMKLYDALAHGHLTVHADWRTSLRTPGHLVTHEKSLFDYVHGSSMMSTERQTSLDVLGVRQMMQQKLVHLHWVPTWRQYADGLTKEMIDELYCKFRREGSINVVQTPQDEQEELLRAGVRRAPRERRKARMSSLMK